ncbi:MAG: chloramphenicol acetyltransferase [Calditrichae bacterium]|nr:chloramphenicol acetyltransferase [Calditrichia bacterium]
MKNLDIDSWKRRDIYNFFKNFDDPFFGITTNIDCTNALLVSKNENISIFLVYLYASLKSANQIENFRFRVVEDSVRVYDVVHASPTINRDNGAFGFGYINYDPEFNVFYKNARSEIERVQAAKELVPSNNNADVIHYSTIPWVTFTGLKHAVHNAQKDSIPKITFGKIFKQDNRYLLPTSLHANHALMDGYHAGLFFEHFQDLMADFKL